MHRRILSLTVLSLLALPVAAEISDAAVPTDRLDRLLRASEAIAQRLHRSSVSPTSGPSEAHLEERAQRLSRLLQIEARRLGKQSPVVERVEEVRGRLDQARPRREPAHERHGQGRAFSTASGALISLSSGEQAAPSPLAPPSNDDCASATPIGNGTFPGDTSEATNDGSASCGVSGSGPDAWFRYTASADGFVSFDTLGSDYDTVLSLHDSCPGTTVNQIGCNDDTSGEHSQVTKLVTAGEELLVRVSGFAGTATGLFSLNAGPAGSISGVVTESGTGTPLAGVEVEIFDAGGSFVNSDSTAADGSYSVGGLASGNYLAVTTSTGLPHVDELFGDIPCPGGGSSVCDLTAGAQIAVSGSGGTSGIDFALDLGGSISGTVTEDGTGTPLVGAEVDVFDTGGSYVATAATAADGSYSVGGLSAGSYFASTVSTSSHVDELFDGLLCVGACDPTDGTPITVTAQTDTPGVDLALTPGGAIRGTVTEDGTGTPLVDVQVDIFNVDGSFLVSTATAGDGTYSVGGLPSGSYFASTHIAPGHIDELFDGTLCPGGAFLDACNAITGTTISVIAPVETTGIDFALTPGGRILGSVTEDGSGAPVAGSEVDIFDEDGAFVGFAIVAADGTYASAGLPTGNYFAATFFTSPHLDELYDELPCLDGPFAGCDPTTGTEIAVTAPADTTGIDFALPLGGTLGGTVTEVGTGTAPAGVEVEIFDASGSFVEFARVGADGSWAVDGLAAGTYFAGTSGADPLVDELYDDVPCPFGGLFGCDPTVGTALTLPTPGKILGIDFALTMGGSIRGTVTEEGTGTPLAGVQVDIFSASGSFLQSSVTAVDGTYAVSGLSEGGYFAATRLAAPYIDELFDDIRCVGGAFFGGCEVTSGTSVVLPALADTTGIDFALSLNRPPIVQILSPAEGSTFLGRTLIDFAASAQDEDGELSSSLDWISDRDGPIGRGGAFTRTLSDGSHVITARVTDSFGSVGSAQISLTVTPNDFPTVTILTPSEDVTLVEGSSVRLSGIASDPEDGNLTPALIWVSNLDGQLGTGGSIAVVPSRGRHTITAITSDSQDLVGFDRVTVSIQVNHPPRVFILEPSNRAKFAEGSPVSFRGAADDFEDGEITPGLSWRSDLDGLIGAGGTFTARLSPGVHRVTATVTDRNRSSARRSIDLIVSALPGPREIAAVPDIDGLGDDEVAVLQADSARVVVFDAGSGLLVRELPVAVRASWRPIDIATLADVNGNGSAELAILARKGKKTRVFVTDVLTAEPIARLRFQRSLRPVDVEAIESFDGPGTVGLAVVGSNRAGAIRVIAKSFQPPFLTRTLRIPVTQDPLDLEIIDDPAGAGSQIVSVLTQGTRNAAPRLILSELRTGILIRDRALDKKLEPSDSQVLPAVEDGAEPRVAVVGEAPNGETRLLTFAALDGEKLDETRLGRSHSALGLRAIHLDEGAQELGVLGENRSDGATDVAILASDTLGKIGAVSFPNLTSPIGFVSVRDLAGADRGALAVLGEQVSTETGFAVVIRDVASGARLQVIPLP